MTRKLTKLPTAIQITDRKNRMTAAVVMLVVLLILTYVPVLTTWLPTVCGFAS